MNTIVIGLGNPILGDDGVGWRVAEAVQAQLGASPVEVDCCTLGGLSLMERLVGYDYAIVVDAVITHQPVGTVARFRLEDFPDHVGANLTAAHDTSLQHALRLGKQLGAHLPERVTVIGIEAEQLYDFTETLTPAVQAAVPRAAAAVLQALAQTLGKDVV